MIDRLKNLTGIALAGLLLQGTVLAQEEGATGGSMPVQGMDQEEIIAYLADELVVAAGVGFRDIRLGDTLQSVIDRWGDPAAARKAGMLGTRRELMYVHDEFSAVVFGGKERIDEITVKGTSSANFRTGKGVRFGMEPNTVSRLYRSPAKGSKRSRYEYPERGITFFFVDSGLDKVVVYEPES